MPLLETIQNFLRPSWRNSNPEVRAEAVRQMDDRHTSQLEQVARTDGDVRVRRLAVKKIADTGLLADLAGAEADDSLRKAIADKLTELLVAHALSDANEAQALAAVQKLTAGRSLAEVAKLAPLAAARHAALQKISDGKVLADVVRTAREATTRLEALGRISDPAILRELSIHEPAKELGLAALERLSTDEDLEAVAKRAKNKTVREAARQRLGIAAPTSARSSTVNMRGAKAPAAVATEASPAARRRARKVQLCVSIDNLLQSDDLDAAMRELAEARVAFAEAGASEGSADEDLQKRFDRAAERITARRAAREEAQAADERKLLAEKEGLDRRLALCAEVEALEGETIPARVETARQAWKTAGAAPASRHAEMEQRFTRAVESALQRHQQGKSRQALRARQETLLAEVESLADPERRAAAEKRLPAITKEWKESLAAAPDDALAQRFDTVALQINTRIEAVRTEERAREAAEQAHTVTRLEEICAGLEKLVETEDRKEAEQSLKAAKDSFESAGPVARDKQAELRTRYQAARDKLAGRISDLRDAEHWKRWANVPRLEALVAKAEALRDNLEIDLKELGPQLKVLQAEWKTVGAAPKEKSEALWTRFKAAGDQIFGRLGELHAKTDEERNENLKKKEELVVQVMALVAESAAEGQESVNWKETSEKIKALQEQWKTIGPVPRELTDGMWKRFREPCDKFFAARKEVVGKVIEERGENLKKKEELCAQVEAMTNIPTANVNWKETADKIKALQDEWKTVGPVSKEQSEVVWKRFREACDKFFDKRKDHFGRLDEERATNLKKKEAIIVELDALLADPDKVDGPGREDAVKQIKGLQAQWKKIGPTPKEQADVIWKKFREGCDRFFQPEKREEEMSPAPTAAEEQAASTPEGISRFTNRLPLEDFLQQQSPAQGAPPVEPPAAERVAATPAAATPAVEAPPTPAAAEHAAPASAPSPAEPPPPTTADKT